jgi:hypothetical protein
MPQVVLLIAAGAGLLFARRWLRGAHSRVADDLKRAKEALAERERRERVTTPLEQDPETGIYRPRR